jgi:hypothetical protein
MKNSINRVSAQELFATEIGVSGAPLPSNGPGRKNPLVKYIIVGGILIAAVAAAIYLNKKSAPKIKIDEDGKEEN